MAKWKRDVLYGIVILLVCIFGIVETQGMTLMGYDYWTTRPDVYVWMWLALLGLFDIAMIVRALIKKNTPEYQKELPPIWCKEGVITIAALVVYLLVMKLIGFIISTVIFEFGLMALYGYKMGKVDFSDKKKAIKKLVFYLIVSVIATVATYYLFTDVLNVRLPKFKLF